MYIDSINKMDKNYPLSSFGNVLICSNAIKANKTVTFPDGYELDSNLSFKILFKNGHNCIDDSTHMTLSNGTKAYPIVVNKYGNLIPLPIHTMTESNTTVYKSLQPNTILEMYFDSSYGTDGAFVVIGNPIVLSSDDYTIYADGKIVQTIKTEYEFDLIFDCTMLFSTGGGYLYNCFGKFYKNNSDDVTNEELSDYIKNRYYNIHGSYGYVNISNTTNVIFGDTIINSNGTYDIVVGYVKSGTRDDLYPTNVKLNIKSQTHRERLVL